MNRPNVLFLLSDQHNANIAGYMGDSVINTPNLDAIAEGGAVFERAYCQSPLCTPSRASFLTGKYCHNNHTWTNHAPIFPEHQTMAHRFAAGGYETCLVGKMHFGGRDQFQGFAHRPYGDLWHGLGHQPDPIDHYPNMPGGQMWNGPAQIPESMLQEVVTSVESAAFIKEHHANSPDKPWFLCASYCRPHPPFPVPSRYHKKYEGRVPNKWLEAKDQAVYEDYAATVRSIHHEDRMEPEQNRRAREAYYACIDFVDDCIGSLLRELERDGLLENTIILYTSDHGEMCGSHGMWNKAQHYEDAVRSPLVMCGPGVPKGFRTKTMVGLFDIMPTLLELCSLPVPADIDGVSLCPLFRGDSGFVPHEHIVTEYLGITSLDRDNYKKSSSRPYPSFRAVITERYKYSEPYETDERRPTLFDLKLDPDEFVNRHGSAEYADIQAKLKAILDEEHTMDEWAEIAARDAQRAKEFRDGIRPGTPNQYMLRDGRIFDAEKGLYDARWLQTSSDSIYGGFIPQRYH